MTSLRPRRGAYYPVVRPEMKLSLFRLPTTLARGIRVVFSTVVHTTWNQMRGSYGSSRGLLENLDPNVRVQFATEATAVLKEPTSKPVETARVPESLKLFRIKVKMKESELKKKSI
ncbi:hypothetical protein TNCV_2333721 [Trichonephila clavipes]|nr:hypothetical protein TNCV_2333721 [Trichonephila clavipes]